MFDSKHFGLATLKTIFAKVMRTTLNTPIPLL